ncbi:hypothetical protein NUH88_06200 [Nisaea acidiphila]|uniref:Uncharacterized protein n=1 Tax=Nisaea acidiphila TaxID=1862145 RepID=A0A9J7AXX0_9PROT|nr:hypothetical protein [Nisaea acidiphila]UUX51281.1 hypothetical protein NUH88_06200 [Nisaea acidiphila]
MPVTNPVNNTTNTAVAQLNCAFCSLCGVLNDSNFGGLVGFFFNQVFPQNPVTINSVQDAFWDYWESEMNLAHDDTKSLERQVAGVAWFLSHIVPVNQNVTVDKGGSTDNPLDFNSADTFMNTYPQGTRFAYMIGEWNDDFEQFVNAHWLTAEKTAHGIQYTDYQMDVAAGIRQAVAAAVHVDANTLAAPHVTNAPRRPWGAAVEEDDRAVVIAYLPF